MENKKTQTQSQNISPDKYIQTQARNLPINECLINSNWKESMMCSILISRTHNNGNRTGAVYLVDLYCLGVKEADSFFNQTPEENTEFKQEYFPEDFFQSISYSLAHNIILAGIEFANDYGFKPCKGYTQRAQFILEEDTDAIELIEIECGSDNKPFIIAGDDNREEAEKAHNHLLNTVGPDEFFYTDYQQLQDDAIEELNENESSDDLPIEEYIYNQPLTERIKDIERLKELSDFKKHTNEDEPIELLYISKKLFYNYYGLDKIETARNLFVNFLNINIDDESIPQTLSGTPLNTHDEKIEEILDDLNFGEDLKKYNLKKLANQHPEVPFYSYMHIIEMNINKINQKKIFKQTNEYLSIYPNYLMLKLENEQQLMLNNKNSQLINDKLINESTLSQLFNNREHIHSLEFLSFHSAMFSYLLNNQNLLLLDAFIFACNILFPDLSESFIEKELISELSKLEFCKDKYL